MTYNRSLAALADPTRQAIIEILRRGPSAVGDLAERIPVSRPAISQHLKVLSAAGILEATSAGTRRIYRLSPEGLEALCAYFDGLWGDALDGLSDAAPLHKTGRNHMTTETINPIRKTLDVALPPEAAFEAFIHRIGDWWPLDTHSLSANEGRVAAGVTVEPKVGGRIAEMRHDGATAEWATVTEWEPGRRIVLDWYVGRDPNTASWIEVIFEPRDGGTRVSLTHAGFENQGPAGSATAARYDEGWDLVLGDSFRRFCADAR